MAGDLGLKGEAQLVAEDERRRQQERFGQLAGVLFMVGGLASIPAEHLLLPHGVPLGVYLLNVLALASALACFVIPWERLPHGVLSVVPPLAAVEVAIFIHIMGPAGSHCEWFFVFGAVFIAYGFVSRAEIAAQLSFTVLAAMVPLLTTDDPRAVLGDLALLVPCLVTTTVAITRLREGVEERERTLARMVRRDPLTRVGNYQLLSELVDYEITRHLRTGGTLALLVLDLDGFKALNDTLGHPAGDQRLRDVAAALRSAVRGQDTVCRQGGDEFAVIMPDTDYAAAEALVARVESRLADVPASASIGIATFPHDATTPDGLLEAADRRQRDRKADRRAAFAD
jgi:diguanylate cyclase (GGDEF)-like protein